MLTLSNVKTQGGESYPHSVRLTPEAFPEAKSSKTGVSVRYVPSPEKKWFVLRASYGRVESASDFLIEKGTYTYVARRCVQKYSRGKKKRYLEPLIPNLFFAYANDEVIDEYVGKSSALPYLSYYYNHFEVDEEHKNPPLIISESNMNTFILETMNQNEHLVFSDSEHRNYKRGDLVEVMAGEFRGIVGHLIRFSGQQRIAVGIPGLGTVFTAYIPTAFLRRIE